MIKKIDLRLPAHIAFDDFALKSYLESEGHLPQNAEYIKERRSIDARGRKVLVNLSVSIFENEPIPERIQYKNQFPNVSQQKTILIVGAGPAGLFAALRCIELGFKPIVFERGKDVKARRRDLAAINKDQIVNSESNYCFGEGGAGTYSDGKLYTRSSKRGDVRRILEILVAHGAKDEILVDAHPHIGTNKLPKLIENIRENIRFHGGEVHFDAKVTDIIVHNNICKGVVVSEKEYVGEGVILATGHSARDIFELLHSKNIYIESKPFALGVRVEHQQSLIDSIQYHCEHRGDYLPASSYALVTQTMFKGVQRGVFSFCMCPGGFIVPSATQQGEVVVNGMSPSKRDSQFSNSGIVVSIENEDIKKYAQHGALAALRFQQDIERQACIVAGNTQHAPAQRLQDFVQGKVSSSLLETSYQPGTTSVLMDEVLPDFVSKRLKDAFVDFGNKMKGYFTNEAQILGVESRTSSPVRIPRNNETFEHVQVKKLYPCGEGAGYAGGIVSAAMDGENCASKLIESILKK
ncbi:MAG: FAD-binding protein [Cytophagales bacterium]